MVDVTYQREIGRRGAVNVNQIAENFDWSKFAPVIVAPVEGGHFAIVTGSIERLLPCFVAKRKCRVRSSRQIEQSRRPPMQP